MERVDLRWWKGASRNRKEGSRPRQRSQEGYRGAVATVGVMSFTIAVDANEVVIEALSADSCLKVDIALGVLSIFAIEQKGRPPIGVLLICIFIADRLNAY